MGKEQNIRELKKCRVRNLMDRIDINLLKKYGTEEEIAARGDTPAKPEAPKEPKKPKRRKYKRRKK